jgi:phage tail sheath protein FI
MEVRMPAPSITVNEVLVGPRPVTITPLNKIGLVGMANWGPVNVPTLVQSLAELKQKFGPTYESGLTALLSAHAIYAQNARAGVYVVRIAPTSVAAVKAAKTFSAKVTLTALYPGTEGNNISVTIANGTTVGKKYTVVDANLGITEVWDNVVNTNATTNTFAAVGGPNEPGAGSKLVSFAYAGDGDPSNAAASLLSTGTPGTNGTPQASDYVGAVGGGGVRSGFYALDPISDVYYIVAAQNGGNSTVQTGLQTYVAGRGVAQGFVRGLLNPGSGQDPASVSIGSLDSQRLGMFWPWVKSDAVPALEQGNWIAPEGFVAGWLSTAAPNEGPINKQLLGITDLQYAASDAQVDTLSDARVNAITATRGRGIRMRDGHTLSSDSAWLPWELRSEYDWLETAIWDATAWALGEPIIPSELWPHLAAQADLICRQAVGDGTIVAFKPALVSDVNNTPDDIAAGRVRIGMNVQFTYDARNIIFTIVRVLDASAA